MSTPETPATPSMPDITSVQKLVGAVTAVLPTALAVATSFGAHISIDQGTKISALWVALGGFLVVADAIIRHGRSTAHAAIAAAQLAATPAPAPLVATTRKPATRKPAARKPSSTAGSTP